MWPTIARRGAPSAPATSTTLAPTELVRSSAPMLFAGARQTSAAGVSYPEGAGTRISASRSSGVSLMPLAVSGSGGRYLRHARRHPLARLRRLARPVEAHVQAEA